MNLARHLMIDLSGPTLTADERAFLAGRRPGGLCIFARNVVDRLQLADLIAEVRSLAGEELIVAADQEGGGVVRVLDLPYPPSAMALGAADDPDLTRGVANATGRGLRALGINVNFAPVADVNSNPANPVIADRAFGSEPGHVARHVAAFVGGLQEAGVAATVKHFPGHGDVDVDSHLALPRLERTPQSLCELELPPFEAAFRAGAAAVMSGHIVVPELTGELPATLSRAAMTDLLRGRLGFGGVVFSDALEMRAVADRWDYGQAAPLALAAGVDMAAQVGTLADHERTIRALEAAQSEGRLPEEQLAESAARLRRLQEDFPAAPQPAAAWAEGDEELLQEAAGRALVATGPLPALHAGMRVALVSSGASRESAATQATVRPAAQLVQALMERGVEVQHVEYPVAHPHSALQAITGAAAAAQVTLFASTARTALTGAEMEIAGRTANAASTFIHVALWNPYAARALPGPALITFGWRPRSVAAAAEALLGRSLPSGRAPL